MDSSSKASQRAFTRISCKASNIALISEALGHSDLSTTQVYLDGFDNEQIDEASSIRTLFYTKNKIIFI